jgi:Phage P22-like portal protein
MVKDPKDCLAAFVKAQSDEHDNRELSREEDYFCLEKGGQWEDNVVNAMGNRPKFTFDKVNPIIDDIMAEVEGMDFGIRVRPAGGGATKELSETYAGVIRYIENLSDASTIYRQSTRRICRRGVDFIRLDTGWSGEGFDQDILIKSVPDSVNRVWLGYHEKQDGSDAKEAWQLRAMDSKEFEKEYGRPCISVGIDAEDYTKEERSDVATFLEYLCARPYEKTLALLSNGKVIELTKETQLIIDELALLGINVERTRKVPAVKVYSRFLDGQDWLGAEMLTVWDSIPIIPVYGNFELFDGNISYSSITRRLMDAQRVYNYARSREIEEGALAPRKKLLMTAKQVSNKLTQKQLSEMNTSADPVLIYTADGEAPPPFETAGPQINPNLANTAAASNQDMAEQGGVYSAQQGANPRYQSGWAVEQMISKGDAKTTKWLNSTAIAVRRIANMIIAAIPKVYDNQRQLRILNDDGTDDMVTINEEVIDQQTGRVVTVNDLSQGKYDVVVELDKAFKSRRNEAAERLIALAGIDQSLMIEAADIVYGSIDVPGAEQIRQRKRSAMLKQGMIPDSQMTDEEKQEADMLIQQQQQQAAQQAQQMAPVTQAMIENYNSLTQERMAKILQEQEKLNLQKQKQIDDVMLKLTEMEQKYMAQLNQEAQQNMVSSVNNGQIFDTPTN